VASKIKVNSLVEQSLAAARERLLKIFDSFSTINSENKIQKFRYDLRKNNN
jgi:hypothetical protein